MKNKQYRDNLSKDILLTTMKIQVEFPELVKYLDEILVNFQIHSENVVSEAELRDYLESLQDLIETYSQKH